jgi:hypothetical protein
MTIDRPQMPHTFAGVTPLPQPPLAGDQGGGRGAGGEGQNAHPNASNAEFAHMFCPPLNILGEGKRRFAMPQTITRPHVLSALEPACGGPRGAAEESRFGRLSARGAAPRRSAAYHASGRHSPTRQVRTYEPSEFPSGEAARICDAPQKRTDRSRIMPVRRRVRRLKAAATMTRANEKSLAVTSRRYGACLQVSGTAHTYAPNRQGAPPATSNQKGNRRSR